MQDNDNPTADTARALASIVNVFTKPADAPSDAAGKRQPASAGKPDADTVVDPAELAARRRLATGVPETVAPPPAGDDHARPMFAPPPQGASSLGLAVGHTGKLASAQREGEPAGGRVGLSSVVEHVDALLKDIERSKATLAQRTAALATEREAHHDVKMRHRLLSVEHERMTSEFTALQTELDRQSNLATELEGTIVLLQQTLAEKTRLIGDNSRRAEAEREKHSQLHEETQRGRTELSAAEERLYQLEASLSAAQDAVTATEAEARKRDIELTDSRTQAARINRVSEETRLALEAARDQAEAADVEIVKERAETARLRGMLQQEVDARRGDAASLQLKLDSFAARGEMLERSMSDLTAELGARTEEVRLLEKFLREQQGSSGKAQDALGTAEMELDEARNGLRELEATNTALSDHAEGLSRSLRSREKEGANWKHKVDSANERLRIETQRFEADREGLGQTIARLTAQLDQEKLARAVSEGALEAARRERQNLSRGLSNVRIVASQAEIVPLTGTHNTKS